MKKYMKKYLNIVILALVAVMALSACGAVAPPKKKSVEKSQFVKDHRDWVDAMGILENFKDAPSYAGEGVDKDTKTVSVYVWDDDNREEAYKKLVHAINAHNDFIDANPTYFDPDTEIRFGMTRENQYSSIFCTNRGSKFYGLNRYGEDLGIDNGSLKVQCVSLRVRDLTGYGYDKTLYQVEEKLNVPVLYIDYIAHLGHDINEPLADSDYDLLEHFENLQVVAIEYTTQEDFDVQEAYDLIQKHYPGVRVYDTCKMAYINE